MGNESSKAPRRGWNLAFHLFVHATLLALALAGSHPAAAQAVKGEVSISAENGHLRLIVRLAEELESQVRIANNIVAITFPKPVNLAVDRIAVDSGGYIAAARRDPDGKAIRLALARKVTMNSIAAAEQLFVDLLPESWTGMPPGLPRAVIDELARRARDAEKKVRQQLPPAARNVTGPIRVRVVVQPNFTRYIFDLPERIDVAVDNSKEKLTLTFDAPLKFDLADAIATLPPVITAIDGEADQDSMAVRFSFGSKADVRTFREENSYVVDVNTAQENPARQEGVIRSDELSELSAKLAARTNAPPEAVAPQQTAPVRPAQTAAPDRRAETAPAPNKAVAPQQAAPARQAPTVVPHAPSAAQSSSPEASAGEGAAPAVPRQTAPADVVNAPEPAVEPSPAPGARAIVPAPKEAAAPPPPPAALATSESRAVIRATVKRTGDNVAIAFPFTAPTPAAVFRRGDAVWLVFDSDVAISLTALDREIGRSVKGAAVTRLRDAMLVRIKLERPLLVSASTDGNIWNITLGTEMVEPTRPLALSRGVGGAQRSSILIAMDDPRNLHRIEDGDAGDTLLVATALAPTRGFLRGQDFVEFRVLPSTHGAIMQPLADDLTADLAADTVVVTRPTGLTLSQVQGEERSQESPRHVLDPQSWGADRKANFIERQTELTLAAADAPESKRLTARAGLARFYLARDMAYEAKGVLDMALADSPPISEDAAAIVVLRAACNILIGRADAGLKDLADPFVGNQHDAALWRALAFAKLGQWAEARERFRTADGAIELLPLEVQRMILKEMVRASIEVGDVTGATAQLQELETIGVPRELEAAILVLTGRLNESLGRMEEARRAYQAAGDSPDRPFAAQGRMRDFALRQSLGEIKRADAIAELETLTAVWRGDATEAEGLQMLARLYAEEARYRDVFQTTRTAMTALSDHSVTRRIQEEATATFDSVFLEGKGDSLTPIEALAMFYDFRELTPIGRRGDEMVRRLADRLVAVDLLFQASELLRHQVEHRLQGAARAQVAARLAVIYLTDRKPDRALAVLRMTRTSELNNELRNQRLLLEARALSETGRHDVAIEVIANIPGREVIRLRSDIYWAAKRWSDASEQMELLYGDRWQEFEPLNEAERGDILRAAIGYSLAEDVIGLARFRERYAAKMGDGPDQRAFDVVTEPMAPRGSEFRDIARAFRSADTLDPFLRDLRARYPETSALPLRQPPPADTAPARPPADPTGTLRPPRSPAGRTAQAR